MANFKIREYDPDKVFFTSDLHFGHEAIIKYCGRPFKDVNEMNRKLVENWNEVVPKNGIVFDLGDFALGGSNVWIDNVIKLNCNEHHLILGNHDLKNFRTNYEELFTSVSMQQVILIDGITIYLNHYPFLCFGGSYKDDHSVWNLFGHVHTTKTGYDGKDAERVAFNTFSTQYDVGVDLNEFKPISFNEVKLIIGKRISNSLWT